MQVMRFNIIDPVGTVSFVAPSHMVKIITAACSHTPRTLAELLDYSESYDPELKQLLRRGLAAFDEHNTPDDMQAIHGQLAMSSAETWPPFRIIDAKTRESSLIPAGTGLVIFNLLAKRIIQVQNAYADLEREDRGRIRRGGAPTNRLYHYRLPDDWRLLP